MGQNKEQKWYPIEYENGCWGIVDENQIDQLWSEDIGEEQAKENAILAASAPELLRQLQEWKGLCSDMYEWLDALVEAENLKITNKHHPVHKMIKQYQELCKKEQ